MTTSLGLSSGNSGGRFDTASGGNGGGLNVGYPTPWRFRTNPTPSTNTGTAATGYGVSTGGTAEEISAALTRAQMRRYKDLFAPIELANLKKLMSPATQTTAAREALATVNKGIADTRGMEARTLERYQARPTSDQSEMIRRHGLLEASLDRAGAYNQTRQTVKDLQTQGMADAISIGRGVAGQALQNSSTAANMQSQRKQAQAQYDATQNAQLWNTIGTGAGLVLALGGL